MAGETPEYGDVAIHDTFPKLLAFNAAHWPDEAAMREKEFGVWNCFTWADYQVRVRQMALGLHALGVERGDVVALIGGNRPEWVWGEVAAHAAGAMSLGIYEDSNGDEVVYLIAASGAKVIVAEDEEQVDKLLEFADQMPCLQRIVYHEPRGMRKYDDPRLLDLESLRALGRDADAARPDLYERLVAEGKGEDVAVLCTTSGTTSRPKLAMLQGGRFLDHCLAYLRADPKLPSDEYVAVLPLSWIMEQVYTVAQPLISRITVNFAEEPETLMADLREIGPTFLLLAPRVWEAVAADVRARMMDATRAKRAVFDLGLGMGMKALAKGRRSPLAHWLLFRALKDRLGFTHIRSAATGGSALGPDTFRFFLALGVPLRQLYGQTELAGAYTLHRADDVDFDSVGVPFDNSEVRIDNPDEHGVGEIVARTPGMFLGYFGNDEVTKASVRDGWMHTGDAGYFSEKNGHLVVIDRVDDIATTARGARFSPMFVENKLKFSPFISEAVVLGNEKPYLAAMVCVRFDIVSRWAEQRRVAFTNYANLASRAEVYDLIRGEVTRTNDTLPEAHRIEKFLLLYKHLDADDGELTRTRKVRRRVVNERYSNIIDAVYGDRDSVHVDTMITFQDGTRSRVVTDLRVVDLRNDTDLAANLAAARAS